MTVYLENPKESTKHTHTHNNNNKLLELISKFIKVTRYTITTKLNLISIY